MAVLMYDSFCSYIKSEKYKGCLKYIQIVIYNEHMASEFKTAVKRKCGLKTRRSRIFSGQYFLQIKAIKQNCIFFNETIFMCVYKIPLVDQGKNKH